ncbi:MAG: amidohydrolase family protein [Thermoanaerobaculia bacterium]
MNAAPQPEQQALLLQGGTILTLDEEASVLTATDLLIEGGRITRIGPELATPPGARVLDVRDCLVLPGLIQGHVHLGQTLFRGLAEGRRLLPWLRERIWPLEAAHDEASAYVSGLVGAAECLLSGTTTVQDIGLGPAFRGLLRALDESGLRAVTGPCLMDAGEGMPGPLLGETERVLEEAEAFGRELAARNDGRLLPALCPRFILSCSDALWRGIGELARRHGWPVHTHALEQPEETEAVRRLKGGRDEIDYFADGGLLEVPLRLAHGVGLTPAHLTRLRSHPTGVVHCPSSNLKLGSGVADVVGIRAAGLPVGVGCDGAACNNDLDVLKEVRLAALLQIQRHGPAAVRGVDALRLVTSEGARVLGLEDEIGSLETGKRADVTVLSRADAPALWPEGEADVHDLVVYGGASRAVRHVVVDGRLLVEDSRVATIDLDALRPAAAAITREVWRRAGLV